MALGSVGENAWVGLPNGLPDYAQVHRFRDLTLSDRSLVQASGAQRGDIVLRGQQVWLREGSIVSVDALGESDGGTLAVTAQNLLLQDGSQLQTGTRGPGPGGNLVVQSEAIAIQGHRPNSRIVSGLLAVSTAEATGTGGQIAVTTNRLTLTDGGQIATTTFGRGDAGNLRIVADAIGIAGGIPGDDLIASGIKAATGLNAVGRGGEAIVTARQIDVRNGGEIQVSTLGSGNAGELRLTVGESLTVQGTSETGQFPSGVRAVAGLVGVNEAVSGAGGNLMVRGPHLQIADGAIVQVSATGSGAAGNLQIEGDRLELRNGAALVGDTRAGAGNLQIATGLLILRENSRISTNAQGVAVGGNLDVQSNVLVALANSDITANAEAARGGRISLQTRGLLGTTFRDRLTPASDITATSELGPEFSGIVEIQAPDRDPNPTVGAFPEQPLDVAPWLTSRCRQDAVRRNRFVWVGGGGLPQAPFFAPLVDLGELSPSSKAPGRSSAVLLEGCGEAPWGKPSPPIGLDGRKPASVLGFPLSPVSEPAEGGKGSQSTSGSLSPSMGEGVGGWEK
ncbi:MAG: S-layer family protein [Oscillatoriales cyanobacterium SM2_1_8]|nr:S-layer family protein [Oscillatoriales cyanobacterium SM2_1_8]